MDDDHDDRTKRSDDAPADDAPADDAPPTPPDRPRTPEDDRVMALLARGDRRGAVALLMETHGDAVFAYCVRMLRDRDLAEDVAQQVFTEAHRDIERFRGESSPKTWLIGIARHRCNDAIKSTNRRSARIELDPEVVVDHLDPATTPTSAIERLDQARLAVVLEHCLQELSPDIRETVLLRFISEMTYEEMATVLGRKADTLCVRVARALPILKRCLEKKGWRHE